MKSDGVFFTYRCIGCRRIVTKLQVLEMMRTGAPMCPCGASSVSPCNIVGLEWLLPRVLKLVLAVWQGKLAPEPEPSNIPPGVSIKQAESSRA